MVLYLSTYTHQQKLVCLVARQANSYEYNVINQYCCLGVELADENITETKTLT
jgi:hypothetical protein